MISYQVQDTMITLKQITTPNSILRLESLAREIWTEHYLPIIGQEQIDYMLEKFQSFTAITRQIQCKDYQYYFIVANGSEVGYLGLVPDLVEDRMKISKIYVSKSARGTGAGTAALRFAKDFCQQQGIGKLWLTVNRHNSDSIKWYQKNGFEMVDKVVNDIGKGYVMDDYIMEMSV